MIQTKKNFFLKKIVQIFVGWKKVHTFAASVKGTTPRQTNN